MTHSTPLAPRMSVSSSELLMAWLAAARARSSPEARPMAISAVPPSVMMAFTSAKSVLMSPTVRMSSEMPFTPW